MAAIKDGLIGRTAIRASGIAYPAALVGKTTRANDSTLAIPIRAGFLAWRTLFEDCPRRVGEANEHGECHNRQTGAMESVHVSLHHE
jgi:hypothetical protein